VERMIVLSDNNAFTLLSRVVDPGELDRVYALLRVQNPRSQADDQFLSVQTYASFFRILYNASYLTKDQSQKALEYLAESEFDMGLEAGTPKEVTVAHKFGESGRANSAERQLHDCGIVYHPTKPYLLCVMTRGADMKALAGAIAETSRLVYAEVDGSTR
ncbi:MAG: serine hydrolase, partial [Elusimicrobiota bacterium]|nr:serine hydrolase [Elusimicrobiota bacterium]